MGIDIVRAFNCEPNPSDFVLPGFLAGTVGALIAPGATGKSYLALEAAMGVACSVTGGDLLELAPDKTGTAVYLAAEDPCDIVKRRLHALGGRLSPDARQAIADAVSIEPIAGTRFDITREDDLAWVISCCAGARLVIFDTLSRIHYLDENSNSDMALVFGQLEYLADQTGAAVLFLHHTSKAASFGGHTDHQHASRGASLLTDSARFAASVIKMSTSEAEAFDVDESMRSMFVRYSVTKNNYGEPLADRWYRRVEGGVLMPAKLEKKRKQSGKGKPRGNA